MVGVVVLIGFFATHFTWAFSEQAVSHECMIVHEINQQQKKMRVKKDIYSQFLPKDRFIKGALLKEDGSITFNYPRFNGALISYLDVDGNELSTQNICEFLLPDKNINGADSTACPKILKKSENFSLCTLKNKTCKAISYNSAVIIDSINCVLKDRPRIQTTYKSKTYNRIKETTVIESPKLNWRGDFYLLSRINDTEDICKAFGFNEGINIKYKRRRLSKYILRNRDWIYMIKLNNQGQFSEMMLGNEYVAKLECK